MIDITVNQSHIDVISEMSQDRIKELESLLSEWREAYYNLDPMVSDQEYDARKTELSYLKPKSKEVTAVGARVSKTSPWEKVKHRIPMGSLDKVNSKNEFLTWAEKTKAQEFLLTHKIDGSSMELIYENGKLMKAVTRGGDDQIGEDVLVNVRQIPNIPQTISDLSDVSVRGEVVMYKDTFNSKYALEYANPRNTANGKIRERKNGGSDCVDLNFVAYTLYINGNLPKTEEDQFKQISDLGFETPFYEVGNMFDLALTFESIRGSRDLIHYEIDGMVIRVNDISVQDGLGSKGLRPNGQIAWKFDAAMASTKVLNIRWQVGNSGRVTPVAEVSPVNIGGVTITSISLHNIALFRKLRLFASCEVLVARRNDVIPYIEKNMSLNINAIDSEEEDED